jgi:hypothetical protein
MEKWRPWSPKIVWKSFWKKNRKKSVQSPIWRRRRAATTTSSRPATPRTRFIRRRSSKVRKRWKKVRWKWQTEQTWTISFPTLEKAGAGSGTNLIKLFTAVIYECLSNFNNAAIIASYGDNSQSEPILQIRVRLFYLFTIVCVQGILKGEVSLYRWPPVWQFVFVCLVNKTKNLIANTARVCPGNTKGGAFNVPLTSCLTGLD